MCKKALTLKSPVCKFKACNLLKRTPEKSRKPTTTNGRFSWRVFITIRSNPRRILAWRDPGGDIDPRVKDVVSRSEGTAIRAVGLSRGGVLLSCHQLFNNRYYPLSHFPYNPSLAPPAPPPQPRALNLLLHYDVSCTQDVLYMALNAVDEPPPTQLTVSGHSLRFLTSTLSGIT
ncbi:hypothetical protein J6590_077980 [Homalodisca vitripennis]|nr:hypothetical protein J6590_077980 [Homalodisca vitripennis]